MSFPPYCYFSECSHILNITGIALFSSIYFTPPISKLFQSAWMYFSLLMGQEHWLKLADRFIVDLRAGVHRERSHSQTIRPCHHAVLSLPALCTGRSHHHPYLTGGTTQGPEGKAASLWSRSRAQSRIQPSLPPSGCSLQEMLVPWQ